MVKKLAIVGAGPSGLLLAHYLLRRGEQYKIEIYERRSDPRTVPFAKSRTFPIALGNRGIAALQKIPGLVETVKAMSLPTTGSILHQPNGKTQTITRKKPLFTLDRTNLAIALLNQLVEKYDNSRLNIHFNSQCTQVDLAAKQVTFERDTAEKFTADYDLLVGADGANSAVRDHLCTTELFECQKQSYRNEYKSIYITNPTINLQPGKIHTWRIDDGSNIILLNQPDGSISGVIYFPQQKNQITSLTTTEEVQQFFRQNFPEFAQLIPQSEAEAFLNRPISQVITIRCNRYHYDDSVVLMGDAAHAVSPALGQGCSSALEDVVVFDNLLDEYTDNLAAAIENFSIRRQPDAHALAELSENAFPATKGLFLEFILRQRLSQILHQLFPQRFLPSLFEVVSDTTVPYRKILQSYEGWVSKVKNANNQFYSNL
ncbi:MULTISPECIES: FAD-dependent oxidoreductase [unclassified Tolypothrix]|uniref:FAD-dependent oxidoreductase n=1 Tax=unclassified Tolypothrix TaxID=2649714 RepID=UPI0005EAA9BC|nr:MULTISPECIES: NAD(P)/FAD-dependent oxidoreductase [unclassified Tolypothrix]BAY92147.1 Kynurenine 3-monooxygenase [Microchaete diplosiphon NIES-3275]EKF04626.1 putative monooxygenase [Tolypothrix sp. PCC 7601]MBE9084981.1 FAD-dependent monooxygenase [Tolypothrix sp. LEGE 11397]UYD26124.1 FAD-dependent monooxygenase [Tolypothrix sp. PCC 7712]UYD31637.1 FAD-dependent monooxygenase [Tolypothrix sp. PCC 7601]